MTYLWGVYLGAFFWGLAGFVVAVLAAHHLALFAFKRDEIAASEQLLRYVATVETVRPIFCAIARRAHKLGIKPEEAFALLERAGLLRPVSPPEWPASAPADQVLVQAARVLRAAGVDVVDVLIRRNILREDESPLVMVDHGWPTCALDVVEVGRGIPLPRRLEAAGYVGRLSNEERDAWVRALDNVRENVPLVPGHNIHAFAAEMTEWRRAEIRAAIQAVEARGRRDDEKEAPDSGGGDGRAAQGEPS